MFTGQNCDICELDRHTNHLTPLEYININLKQQLEVSGEKLISEKIIE